MCQLKYLLLVFCLYKIRMEIQTSYEERFLTYILLLYVADCGVHRYLYDS